MSTTPLCPKVRDRAFHFISPHLPAGRRLSGKELHPGQVAHEGHNLFPGLVRLFAVGFNRGNDKLMDICRLPFGMAPGSQQADLSVSPRPEAKAIKPTVCLFILFESHKGHRLIAEAPRLYEPQGLRELGESRPQKKCAVRGGQISHRERTQLVNPHCGISCVADQLCQECTLGSAVAFPERVQFVGHTVEIHDLIYEFIVRQALEVVALFQALKNQFSLSLNVCRKGKPCSLLADIHRPNLTGPVK